MDNTTYTAGEKVNIKTKGIQGTVTSLAVEAKYRKTLENYFTISYEENGLTKIEPFSTSEIESIK